MSIARREAVGKHSAVPGTASSVCEGFGTSVDDYNLRVASIFIVLCGSLLGVFLPMALAHTAPNWCFSQRAFFFCKYFGTGVILSTSFMHLLSPAVEALSDECLSSYIPDFDWAHAICLSAIMFMFYLELVGTRFNSNLGHYDTAKGARDVERSSTQADNPERDPLLSLPAHMPANYSGHKQASGSSIGGIRILGYTSEINNNSVNTTLARARVPTIDGSPKSSATTACDTGEGIDGNRSTTDSDTHSVDLEASVANHTHSDDPLLKKEPTRCLPASSRCVAGVFVQESHADHDHHTIDIPDRPAMSIGDSNKNSNGDYSVQITSLLILEFGVVFHSLFIGLSLAGTDNIRLLLTVLTFHQFFEGLGLGARLAVAQWPARWQAWTGFGMAVLYGITTPFGVVIGLCVNAGLASRPALGQLMNGIFDSVSAGILVYTALVELLAHEFIFNEEMLMASVKKQQTSFGCVVLGAAAMTLLAKWA